MKKGVNLRFSNVQVNNKAYYLPGHCDLCRTLQQIAEFCVGKNNWNVLGLAKW